METILPFLEALQNAELPTALRLSNLAYPLVNAAHIVSIGLLFGSIIALDLRLVGFWPSVPAPLLSRVLLPVAITGLIAALATGGLLFSVHAAKYAALGVFQIKLGLIATAIVNALVALRLMARQNDGSASGIKLAAAFSIVFWTAIILCGRMIAYYA
jgi:hypothetical protein